jgi:ribonucleoside-diphosphate reductase beta chain
VGYLLPKNKEEVKMSIFDKLKPQKVFDIFASNRSTRIVNGECSGILNWNDIRMVEMYKLYKVLMGNHWIADELPMSDDVSNYKNLPVREQEAFKKIIGLLAVLDAMQTMYVGSVKDYLTDSSFQAIAAIVGQQEVVHNQSYSYVLSSIVSEQEQKEIFEYWKHDEVLLKRNLFISELYQDFIDNPTPYTFFKSLVADMILEGIFFYAGFAFFYNTCRTHRPENTRMMVTQQMISYIQRDEGQHTFFFSGAFRLLLEDYPELNAYLPYVYEMFDKAVQLEVEWAKHTLYDIDGIDIEEFEGYIRHIANMRLKAMGLDKAYEGVHNSMPWIRPYSDETLNDTKTDFFEGKSRTYAKSSAENEWDEL